MFGFWICRRQGSDGQPPACKQRSIHAKQIGQRLEVVHHRFDFGDPAAQQIPLRLGNQKTGGPADAKFFGFDAILFFLKLPISVLAAICWRVRLTSI